MKSAYVIEHGHGESLGQHASFAGEVAENAGEAVPAHKRRKVATIHDIILGL